MANINKVNKGYRIEKRCEEELQAEGYITWKTIRVKFQNIDFFSLFDVVGLSVDGTHLRFIQVKTGYCPNKVKEEIRNLAMPECCVKEIWQWFDDRKKTTKKQAGWLKEIIQ